MRSLPLVILASLLATGSAAIAGHEPKAPPEARETGKAVDCVSLTQLRESRVRSDQVIDFRTSGKKWYRNTLPYSCPSLGFEERFSYKTSLSQLCSTDIITVFHTAGGAIRWPGVLQRLALCALGVSTFLYFDKPRGEPIAVALILVGYWLLMTRVPVPGFGAGVLTPEGNLASSSTGA